MGSCVSVHKDPDSAMKFRLSVGSKNEKLLIPSPVKEKPDNKVNGGDRTVADLAIKSNQWSPPRFREAGSKEEAFFDSQPWLDSDCEDDFLSVNGDFTPSHGSTPVHHKFSSGNPPTIKAPDMEATFGSVPQPSPPNKKRLSELFKESLRSQDYVVEENAASHENVGPTKVKAEPISAVQLKGSNGTGGLFRANSGSKSVKETPNGMVRAEDESEKSAQCCLPSLRSSRSFSERKKKMSPTHTTG